MTPSLDRAAQEAAMCALARLIAQCKEVSSNLAELGLLSAEDAPFLHGQLAVVLGDLERAVRSRRGRRGRDKKARKLTPRQILERLRRSEESASGTVDHLEGASWAVTLPDVIAFLAERSKTGILWVHAPSESFLLELREGRLVHATSDNSPRGDYLGEILVENGFLDPAELRSFLDDHDGSDILGASLVAAGLITEEQLQVALGMQIHAMVLRLLKLDNAIFRYRDGVEVARDQHVDLNVTQVLLECTRHIDENA